MLERLGRVLRANLGHIGRSARDRVSRVFERFDGPAATVRAAEPRAGEAAARASRRLSPSEEVRRAFAALEIPIHASPAEVRHAYRRLVARYHPDRHSADREKESVATEVTSRLTEAYDIALDWARRGRRTHSSTVT